MKRVYYTSIENAEGSFAGKKMTGNTNGKKKKSKLTYIATGTMFLTFVFCCCLYGSIVIPALAEKNVRATMLPDVATRPVEAPKPEQEAPEEIVKGAKNVSIDVINPGMEDGTKGGSMNAMPLYAGETVAFTLLQPDDCFYVFIVDTETYKYPSDFSEYEGTINAGRIIQVLAFSDNGWAAVYDDGIKYVESSNMVPTIKPETWNDEDTIDPASISSTSAGEDGAILGSKFFNEIPDGKYYVIEDTTQLRLVPTADSSGSVAVDGGTMVNTLAFSDDGWAKVEFASNIYYVNSDLLKEPVITEETTDEAVDADTGSEEGSGSSGSSDSKASTTPAPQAPAAETVVNTAPNTEAGSLLAMVNDLRAANGIAPLSWSDDLASCANTRAAELPYATDEQNMSHIRPDGSEWWTVNPSIMYGENLACGQQSAAEVFQAWVDSPSHKANMLDPDYTKMGAALCVSGDGAYGTYWVQEFG